MPRTLDDWLHSDHPLLTVHAVTFQGHTLLTVSYPHVLMDAQGLAVLLKGWSAVLRGQQDQVPRFQGFRVDPLSSLGDHGSPAKFGFQCQILSAWGALLFGLRFLTSLIWYKFEQRMMVVPQAFLAQTRQEAMKRLTETSTISAPTVQDGASELKEAPFISDGDVLLAWWTRMALQSHRVSPHRVVSVMGTIDIRKCLEKYFGPGPTISYLGNAALPLYAVAPVGLSLASDGISSLAHVIRRAILLQREPDHIEATATLIRKRGNVPLVGNASMKSIFYTNWHQAGYFDIDFSAAVAALDGSCASFSGRPELIIPNTLMSNGEPLKFTGIVVIGRDPKGDWIIQNIMHQEAMRRFEKELQGLRLGN